MTTILFAAIIGGAICAVAQALIEIKIPFPVVVLIMVVAGGGILTYTGVLEALLGLGAGGVSVTALGCGNAGYSAGVQLSIAGNPAPLVLSALLNVVLVLLGAIAGIFLAKKLQDKSEEK